MNDRQQKLKSIIDLCSAGALTIEDAEVSLSAILSQPHVVDNSHQWRVADVFLTNALIDDTAACCELIKKDS